MWAVKQFRGDYPRRQQDANDWGADLYIESHYNAKAYEKDGAGDNYTMALVGSNASKTSKRLALWYANEAHDVLSGLFPELRMGGVHQPRFRGRGDANLRYTNMPAVLLEPLFISDPKQELFAATEKGQELIAGLLVALVKKALPNGGKVALSTGHKGKDSNPNDPGAVGPGGFTEANLADKITQKAIQMLVNSPDHEKRLTEKKTMPEKTPPTDELLRAIIDESRDRDRQILDALAGLSAKLDGITSVQEAHGERLTKLEAIAPFNLASVTV